MRSAAGVVLTLLIAAAQAGARPPAVLYPEVEMDPRFELLAMVQLLAGADRRYAGFFRHDIPYDRAAAAYFAPFARHPVVAKYAEMSGRGLNYLAAYQFVFALSAPPDLELKEELPDSVVGPMGGRESLEEFRLLLADFARTAGFQRFYEQSAADREPLLKDIESQVAALDCKGRLERYIGLPVETRYGLIISPFAEPVLSATFDRAEPDGRRRLTSVYGPEEEAGRFGFRFKTRLGPAWREILGSMLASAAKPYRDRLTKSEKLFSPVAGSCAASWYECAQRHVAFAVGARLVSLHVDPATAEEWPVKYGRIGLPYLGPLIERLKEYEAHRDRYPTLMDFYPRLADVFDELASRGVKPTPFLGDITSLQASSGPVTMILPSDEPNRSLRRSIREQAQALQRRFWPAAETLSDAQALAADLSGRTLVVVGTLDGNRWLRRHFKDLNLPAHFEPGRIVFNPRSGEVERFSYAGSGKIGLISTGLNPFDATRGLLLYTASEAQALPQVFDGYSVAADFVIVDGGSAAKIGLYEKSRIPWRLK